MYKLNYRSEWQFYTFRIKKYNMLYPTWQPTDYLLLLWCTEGADIEGWLNPS